MTDSSERNIKMNRFKSMVSRLMSLWLGDGKELPNDWY